MTSCNSDQLAHGDNTNDNVVTAIGALLEGNWLNQHTGTTVVARFGDGTQATFIVDQAGTLNEKAPGTGCTPQDTGAWNYFSETGSTWIEIWAQGDLVNVWADAGGFTGGTFYVPPPGNNH